jgi:hypothetical protein
MGHWKSFRSFAASLLTVGGLLACATQAAPQGYSVSAVSPTPGSGQLATFTDPFAYCAAVGTVDAPDSRYTGPKVPEAVAQG